MTNSTYKPVLLTFNTVCRRSTGEGERSVRGRKSRALKALVEVLKVLSLRVRYVMRVDGATSWYDPREETKMYDSLNERSIDSPTRSRRSRVVADGWECILRVLTEYSCPSSLLAYLIDRITHFKGKKFQERLLRVLDECVFRNDFDRSPRTRISMLTMNCGKDADKDSDDSSFGSGTRINNIKAKNILSPTRGHTICFWLRMDGADPDLFQPEIRSTIQALHNIEARLRFNSSIERETI